MVFLQLSGYYIQLAENDLTLRKMTTKPSIIIWSILPKDVPVTCKSVFFTSCKIIKMVHYLLLLNTPEGDMRTQYHQELPDQNPHGMLPITAKHL